jgi:CubicO group peptidase (beta-lactamase class C family)
VCGPSLCKAFVAIVLALPCVFESTATGEQDASEQMSPSRQREIRAEVRAAAEREMYRGALLVVVGGKNIVAEGFGPRFPDARPGTEEHKTIGTDSLFEIASISKGFTAIAVLQLVEQGKLTLDSPISTFFPEQFKPGSRVGELTVQQLLSHTTGLDGNTGLVSYAEPSRQKLLSEYARAKPLGLPGAKWGYHNGSYNVIAAIIESVSGQDFRTYMRERVFAPAGMSSTGILGDQHLERRRAIFRSNDPGARSSLDWACGWGYLGSGGVVTSLKDVIAFENALASDVLISTESKRTMFTPIAQAESRGANTWYALGWFVDIPDSVPTSPRSTATLTVIEPEPAATVHHGGSVRGVRAWWTYRPAERTLIGAFGDEGGNPHAMVRACEMIVSRKTATKRPEWE